MPKVSILVPVYNTSNYLKECLDSLVGQTLPDIEIIVINDGSTDNSLDIIQEYASKDDRIRIIDKENSGYGASMNRGLGAATGEYIGIVESDDFVKLEMFEELYEIASKNDLDIVKSDFYSYFSKNKISKKAGNVSSKNKVFSVKGNVSILKMLPSIWSAIYKKDFLFENNIRFLETKGASYQDTSFAFKTLACAKRIMFTNKAYVYYRSDNENSSVKSKSKIFAICDEFDEITKFLNKNPEIKSIVNSEKLKIQFNRYKWNLLRIEPAFRGEFVEKFKETFKVFCDNGEMQLVGELKLLLEDKEGFIKYIEKLAKRQEQKEKRRKLFSVRIGLSGMSIILFGKQIVGLG